ASIECLVVGGPTGRPRHVRQRHREGPLPAVAAGRITPLERRSEARVEAAPRHAPRCAQVDSYPPEPSLGADEAAREDVGVDRDTEVRELLGHLRAVPDDRRGLRSAEGVARDVFARSRLSDGERPDDRFGLALLLDEGAANLGVVGDRIDELLVEAATLSRRGDTPSARQVERHRREVAIDANLGAELSLTADAPALGEGVRRAGRDGPWPLHSPERAEARADPVLDSVP